ncbi:hypothetical protein J6590_044346 [Homalodisca vitripennis]|nr:hypothetical protein J6590_044346 [Homalodisca vitripennis]
MENWPEHEGGGDVMLVNVTVTTACVEGGLPHQSSVTCAIVSWLEHEGVGDVILVNVTVPTARVEGRFPHQSSVTCAISMKADVILVNVTVPTARLKVAFLPKFSDVRIVRKESLSLFQPVGQSM